MWRARNWSLANRQLFLLASSLTIIALLLGLGGAWYIQGFTERTSDRVLRASVNAIAETVAVENGQITLEVPPGAFGMLEDTARDNVYYAVRIGAQTITGYRDFPQVKGAVVLADETLFRYDRYLDQPVRVATQARYLPRNSQPVIVEVAETLDERQALSRAMLFRLVLLEALLVIMAALLIRPAIRWGLLPLTKLQRQISEREPHLPANQPIETAGVPFELRGLVDTFNLLLGRLDASIKRVRDFTGDASHQMRTPLAALRTHLMLVRRHGTQSADGASALAEVESAAIRLQRLLGQLLALARSDDALASGIGQRQSFDLAQVAREVTGEHAPDAVRNGIEITLEAEEPMLINGDPLIVSEMIGNVIDNAIRYIPSGGRIAVRCIKAGSHALIEVEDDGPGIPTDQRPLVFNRFYRLNRDRELDGSGLGLAIVRSLAEATGAAIQLDEGQGGKGLMVRFGFVLKKARMKGSRK